MFAPRDIPHKFTNVGGTPASMLVTVTPAGLEEYFAEARKILCEDPTNMEAVVTLARRYGMELMSPDQQ